VNEFEFIARLTASLPSNPSVVLGPGDDCAVLDLGVPGRHVLFKTDAVVEGVHFTSETPAERVGHKALARCLSDIAAMGGMPWSAVITLGLPGDDAQAWAEQAYAGLAALARRYAVALVGGETTTSPERRFLSVALIGHVEQGRAVRRSGAKAGDAVFVTGELGGSSAGRHLDFEPRLPEAQWLCDSFPIHSMIDLSDGLGGDLLHILNASGVGAELHAEAIPISGAAQLAASKSHGIRSGLMAALTDGEDFELLFTVAASDAVRLLDQWKIAFPDLCLGCIGKITQDIGLRLRDKQGVRPMTSVGYTHFSSEQ